MESGKISVVAVIDLDGKHVRLVVTGPLTVDTQTALHPLIRLARVLTPVTRVVVDLTEARITDTAAVEALTRHAWEGHAGHPSQQVRFTLPDPELLAALHPIECRTAFTRDQAVLLARRDGPAPPLIAGDSSAQETLARIGEVIPVVTEHHRHHARRTR